MDAAIFNGLMAWTLPYGVENTKGKSVWEATLAIQKYAEFHREHFSEWDVWILPNGKPAIEITFSVDFENGYKHYCHIDVILQNRETKQLAVQENKTTGFKTPEEALYANSSQGLSYSVLIDQLTRDSSYEVFYSVYSSVGREWYLFPFTKSIVHKAEWINDIQLDHASLSTYKQIGFYPKRGESCFNYMKRCEFFGICNVTHGLTEPGEMPIEQEAEPVDFAFKLSDIIATQKERIG